MCGDDGECGTCKVKNAFMKPEVLIPFVGGALSYFVPVAGGGFWAWALSKFWTKPVDDADPELDLEESEKAKIMVERRNALLKMGMLFGVGYIAADTSKFSSKRQ